MVLRPSEGGGMLWEGQCDDSGSCEGLEHKSKSEDCTNFYCSAKTAFPQLRTRCQTIGGRWPAIGIGAAGRGRLRLSWGQLYEKNRAPTPLLRHAKQPHPTPFATATRNWVTRHHRLLPPFPTPPSPPSLSSPPPPPGFSWRSVSFPSLDWPQIARSPAENGLSPKVGR